MFLPGKNNQDADIVYTVGTLENIFVVKYSYESNPTLQNEVLFVLKTSLVFAQQLIS